jgi:excisionase family DNA binding protein
MTALTEKWVTIPELADQMGLSRIAVYYKVKTGEIPARKIGRNYAISGDTVCHILGQKLTRQDKDRIRLVVRLAIKDYGEVFRWLAKE